jgi:hypothetical protein
LVDVLLRTLLYGLGVILVLLLEKAFDGRHDYGGFTASLRHLFQHADIYHVWIDSIVIALSLLVFNVFTVIRRHLGTGGLARLLLSPPWQSAPCGDVSPAAQPNRSGAPLAGLTTMGRAEPNRTMKQCRLAPDRSLTPTLSQRARERTRCASFMVREG